VDDGICIEFLGFLFLFHSSVGTRRRWSVVYPSVVLFLIGHESVRGGMGEGAGE
jgi:hypothetical protein